MRYAYTDPEDMPGTALETITYTYGDSNWKDKLTAFNGSTITYDNIGNPLNDGTWTYTWQAGRQLARMSKSGISLQFRYNHSGLRTQKIVTENGVTTTTEYIYHGKLLTHLKQGNNDLHFFYDAQSRPAMVDFNGTKYTYLHNLQGDVVGMLDSAGALVVEYGYDAWGKPVSICTLTTAYDELASLNPFRYRGYVWDVETGLYYLRSRYYKPEMCRFINNDILLGRSGGLLRHNIFAYCLNSPVHWIDSNGLEPGQGCSAYFKGTFYVSGESFYAYLQWLYGRHPNVMPNSPIIDAVGNVLGEDLTDYLAGQFGTVGEISKALLSYGIDIIEPFPSYNYKVEGVITNDMARQSSIITGYKAVKVELLYGSHSAEVGLTFLDTNNNLIKAETIVTQGYDVILDMMTVFEDNIERNGGFYEYENVEWKYSLSE